MIPVKIQCTCGQRYAFETEPYYGRMMCPVACPVCGVDGTLAANEAIAFALSDQASQKNSNRETVMAFTVIGCLAAGLAGTIKACEMAKGFDVLLCLIGAVTAFGLALCVYFWKR
jgi:uncharacterized sodium:solute symporter family permease YidK